MRTDAELLADDFGAFYERHLNAVTAYLSRRTQRAEQTFDLVAEMFARALEHRRRYDAAREQLVEAARPRRRRRLPLPLAGVLALSASGAAALTLSNHPSKPLQTARYRWP